MNIEREFIERRAQQRRQNIANGIQAMDKFYHVSNGRAYGPSEEGETLAQYKARVRKAYGSLSGITFGTRADLHPATFW